MRMHMARARTCGRRPLELADVHQSGLQSRVEIVARVVVGAACREVGEDVVRRLHPQKLVHRLRALLLGQVAHLYRHMHMHMQVAHLYRHMHMHMQVAHLYASCPRSCRRSDAARAGEMVGRAARALSGCSSSESFLNAALISPADANWSISKIS